MSCHELQLANKLDLIKEDPSQRQVSSEEIAQFAKCHNLVYNGESSALSDTNIKEVVEALLESRDPSILIYRNTRRADAGR